MNDQFKSVFSNIDKITETEFESNCKLSIKSNYQTMPDITITCEGIAKLLLNLNPNKAADPDEIKPRVLKELATEIAPILTIIFKYLLNQVLSHQTGKLPMLLLFTRKIQSIIQKITDLSP